MAEFTYNEVGRRQEFTVFTTVDYVFVINGMEVRETIEVPHFNTDNEEDILMGIQNRGKSRYNELIADLREEKSREKLPF